MASTSTVSQDVYRRLRSDLLACRLAPGEKLKIEELCQRFSAGSSAVREALSRLASDGFVVMEPQRGFRVTPVSFDELRDLTDTRCQIEGLCIRDAVRRGDIEWEAGLVTALHRLSRTPMRAEEDPQRYSDVFAAAHTQFHEAVVAACRSPCLLKIREALYFQHERYRWLSMPLARVERNLHAEHASIAEAALARDADRAVRMMTDHLQQTAHIILASPGIADAFGVAAAGAVRKPPFSECTRRAETADL